MSTLVSKNHVSPFIRFLTAPLETRRQWTPQTPHAFYRLLAAAIANHAEFPPAEDPNLDLVAFFEGQALHHGGRKSHRQTVSPFCHAHRYTLLLHIYLMPGLHDRFGPIDIYLFDQLLRGRVQPGMRVLDAGCGSGSDLVYLLREGYEVFGADSDPRAIAEVRRLAAALAPRLPADNFRVERVEEMSFPDAFADVVLASAV